MRSVTVTSIKFPGEVENNRLEEVRKAMENSAEWNISIPAADLQSAVDLNKQQASLSQEIQNNPPKINIGRANQRKKSPC